MSQTRALTSADDHRESAVVHVAAWWSKPLGIAGGLVTALVTLAVFWAVGSFDFLEWDDRWVVFANPYLRGLTWQGIADILLNVNRSGSGYTPLAGLRFAVIHQLWGMDPRPYHVANLIIYVANAVLVYIVIASLLQRLNRGADLTPAEHRWRTLAATLAALLWSLHPLRVETVAWVAAGPHNQALFFLLVAWLAFVRGKSATGGRRAWLALSALAYAGSLLSHPLGLGFVGVLMVWDWSNGFTARRVEDGLPSLRGLLLDKLPFVVVTLAVLGCNLIIQLNQDSTAEPGPSAFGAFAHVMQACYALVYYAWKPLVPFALSPVYTKLVSFDPWAWPFLGSALGALAGYAALVLLRRRWPLGLALALAHLLLLLPLLGLTVHPYYLNDRFSLASSIVMSVLAAHLMVAPGIDRRARRAVATACAVGLLVLVPMTLRQSRIWRDTPALLRAVAASLGSDPARAEIHARLAEYLAQNGRRTEAIASYGDALRVVPDYWVAHAGLLKLCMADEGQRPDAMALDCYHKAVSDTKQVVP